MKTSVTKGGHTVIPAAIRNRYDIKDNDYIVWIDDGFCIKVIPIPADPVAVMKGRGKGENLFGELLTDRREELERES
jgi:bifunctional DNA-binding transcriptional regulator/antitoxin component of YhaV-PrlF toxin-antitoxin module